MGIAEFRKRVLPVIQSLPDNVPPAVRISDNGKTGQSINVSIVETCQPTSECMSYCYGARGPIAFKFSVQSQHNNVLRFRHLETAPQSEVDAECAQIARIIDKGGLGWIRWNGVGDLIPGSVRVINRLATLRPDITQWVVTRKVAECATLEDKKSIKILFSLDTSTPDTIRDRAKVLAKTYKRAKFRFAWTRRDAKPVPRGVHIIFNEHRSVKRGPWLDKRVCEATLPGKNHTNSCDGCKRCFT